MKQDVGVSVGIDVGGKNKGFHAVAVVGRSFEKSTSTDPALIVVWCRQRKADIVAVDAPCGWSQETSSRHAERELGERKIRCYATPSRDRAIAHKKDFYGWVLNGEKLYERLARHYTLFDGDLRKGPICFETFPHAIVCALSGKVVAARPKLSKRRKVLSELGYDYAVLSNLDYVDEALCAVAAVEFRKGHTTHFGGREDGFIVVPAFNARYD